MKEKISNFCHVPPEQVICIHDTPSIYRVPTALEEQGLVPFFGQRLNLALPNPLPRRFLNRWRDLADRHTTLVREVTIALVGKYTRLEDSYASVVKALQHAALQCHHRLHLLSIEAELLEPDSKEREPVRHHEAWQQLCKAE